MTTGPLALPPPAPEDWSGAKETLHRFLQVWTVPTVAGALLDYGDRVHAVEDGERFLAAGIPARTSGSTPPCTRTSRGS